MTDFSRAGVAAQYPEIVVISLRSSVERRQAASHAMREAGLAFRFFDAIDGASAAKACFVGCDRTGFVRLTGRNPTDGEVGCYASHLALWRECVASGRAMVIMEDDFGLRPGFRDALEVVSKQVDTLGFVRLQTEQAGRKIKCGSIGNFQLWRYTLAPQGAMCYAIAPRVAAALVAESERFCMPVDVLIKRFWQHGQPLYGLTPYVVAESDLSWASTIGQRLKCSKSLAERTHRSLDRFSSALARYRYNRRIRGAERY